MNKHELKLRLSVPVIGAPLFIVTAHAPAVAEPDILGANAILAKPFDVETLLAKVDELLGSDPDHMRKTP